MFAAALPYLLVAVAPLCWAGNIVLARGVIHVIPPVAFAFWRWTVAFLILLPFTFRQAARDARVAAAHWRILALLALLGVSGFNTLLYTAVHTITAINGALIQTAMPAVIIIISKLLFKDRVTVVQITGVMGCIIGATLVVLKGNLGALTALPLAQGDILMIIAVVLYALYTVLLRKRPPIHPLSLLTYTFGIGAMGLLPLYIIEAQKTGLFQMSGQVTLSILYVAVFPSIIAYLCWNRGAFSIGPNRTGLFINLIPVFASVLAIVLLGESLRGYHIISMVLIFGGMVIFNR